MDWAWEEWHHYLGMTPLGAVTIVVSTAVLYAVFVTVLSRFGQRLNAAPSALELAVVAVLGAVVGRSMLGPEPTLGTGLLALATLFALEWVSGRVGGTEQRSEDSRGWAVAVVVAGDIDHAELRRHRVHKASLWAVLRGAGVRSLDEVALVVLERSGSFSVLRVGEPVGGEALTGVRDADRVLAHLALPRPPSP